MFETNRYRLLLLRHFEKSTFEKPDKNWSDIETRETYPKQISILDSNETI
jgi:hypothetical protein